MGILLVYPTAEGNQHFVWGQPVNIPPTGGQSDTREGCDSLFVIPHERGGHDLRDKGENCTNGPVTMETEMNDRAMDMESTNSYIKQKHVCSCWILIAFVCLNSRYLAEKGDKLPHRKGRTVLWPVRVICLLLCKGPLTHKCRPFLMTHVFMWEKNKKVGNFLSHNKIFFLSGKVPNSISTLTFEAYPLVPMSLETVGAYLWGWSDGLYDSHYW